MYIKATEGPPIQNSTLYTVHYIDEQNRLMIKSLGSKAWRNNNPGNIIASPFANRHGAIGKAAGMAVFPDEEIGRSALIALLNTQTYRNLKIEELSDKYDKPGADNHRKMLLQISKLDPKKRISELNLEEFELLRMTIERIEGWKIGSEDLVGQWIISGVKKSLGAISDYYISRAELSRWVTKEVGIDMAKNKKIKAVLVRYKKGFYLRPSYSQKPFKVIK